MIPNPFTQYISCFGKIQLHTSLHYFQDTKGTFSLGIGSVSNPHLIHIDYIHTTYEKTKPD